MQPYDLEGSVDDLNRPLVRIETSGFTDSLVAFVDTGFNGALLIDERQAARLGFSVAKESITQVRFDENTMWVALAAGRALGAPRLVSAVVARNACRTPAGRIEPSRSALGNARQHSASWRR